MNKSILYFLLVLIVVGMVSEVIPDWEARDWWPLFDGYKLTPEWYFTLAQWHITCVALCFVLAYNARFFRTELLVYAWLRGLDFIDFLITNNTPWFYVGELPISMNVLVPIIFALTIYRDGRV